MEVRDRKLGVEVDRSRSGARRRGGGGNGTGNGRIAFHFFRGLLAVVSSLSSRLLASPFSYQNSKSPVTMKPLLPLLLLSTAHGFQVQPLRSAKTTLTKQQHESPPLFFAAKKQGGDSSDDAVVTLVHSHHLLDHKPDNMILNGGKYKLRGVGCLGRPGVALCVGEQAAINKFRSKLKTAMPQKKFGTISIDRSSIPSDELSKIRDFEEATIGELRSLLAKLGHEHHFFTLTGIDPSNATQHSEEGGLNSNSKKSAKKRRKK